MKSFEIQDFGIDRLALVERDVPKPGAGQVLVRMTAASINFRDYMVIEGKYNPRMRRPMVPLSDGAGIVEETGPGCTRFKRGDRVASCFFQKWVDGPPSPEKGASALGGAIDGVLREYAVFQEDGLVPVPDHLTDVEAATLPCAGVTAWHALFEEAHAVPGETVLLQGTGGVSTFALLFARVAGLRTIITSSSDEKIALAREFGVDAAVNYKRTPEWDKEARKLTGGVGVDRVIEVGGSGTLSRSLSAVRQGGIITVIGGLTGGEATVGPIPILMNSIRVQGIYVGSRAMFERMNRAIALHGIRPIIDRVFAWTDVQNALRYFAQQQHLGKVCLQF